MADLLLRFPQPAAVSRVRIGRGGLDRLGEFTRRTTGARRVALVSDARVGRLYGDRALRSLRRAGLAAALLTVPPGERSKRPERLVPLWELLGALGIRRGDAVVALGGGVVGDLAGFAAATWLRGVPWVCVPTSLLAQVDSGVGGKTAVDLATGKNLAGAFHQPAGVLVDPAVLATLPVRHRRAGLAEVIKLGMAVDARLFRWVERAVRRLAAGEPAALAEAVTRSIRAKARVVLADEREREGGSRTALNFGHTAGHAIETSLGYRGLLHGEAVALGMRVAGALSERQAGLSGAGRLRLESLLDVVGLPRRLPPIPVRRLLSAMESDKKRGLKGVRWVLTPRVGHASVPRLISGRIVRSALLEAGAAD
ncbi:MAG: 3-dehydroquinate synthase [Candidatus Eisenbacteria bacterium]|nr:3-dehydroquinate synthase [Candidatus Eisenbacteria bacterium]